MRLGEMVNPANPLRKILGLFGVCAFKAIGNFQPFRYRYDPIAPQVVGGSYSNTSIVEQIGDFLRHIGPVIIIRSVTGTDDFRDFWSGDGGLMDRASAADN